jgi:regulator of replication initiation timing
MADAPREVWIDWADEHDDPRTEKPQHGEDLFAHYIRADLAPPSRDSVRVPREKPTIDEIIESLRSLAGEAADELDRLSSDNSVLALENERLRTAAPAQPDSSEQQTDDETARLRTEVDALKLRLDSIIEECAKVCDKLLNAYPSTCAKQIRALKREGE